MADVYKASREGIVWRLSSGRSPLKVKEGQSVTLGVDFDENDLAGDTTKILVKTTTATKETK